jgi:small-conductance mechanosensitive channel
MSLLDFLNPIGDWVIGNLGNIVFSLVTIVVVYVLFRLVAREIKRLMTSGKLEKHLAFTLTRIAKWVSVAVILSAVLAQWGVTLGAIAGVLTIFGGTIIGFAAINTLGNAIAGLIVMTSRPFKVGDRIFFNGQFADVVSIDLIYTKMLTLDNVLVSVPNQELLKAEVDNYGKENVIRRHCLVTPGFEYDSTDVEKALLEAADKTQDVLKEPKPYVWITKFQNYAVEYTLYVFISDIKRLPEIDAALYREVLETCRKHGIDISTPLLLKQFKG